MDEGFISDREPEDTIIVDTRHPDEFSEGFIKGSFYIGIKAGDIDSPTDRKFERWISKIVSNIDARILFVVGKGLEEEVITRLALVGYDKAVGYLDGGIEEWKMQSYEVEKLKLVTPE